MNLVVGQSMLRVDDGMRGLVVVTEGDIPRIAYVDRGEQRFAGKGEKWEPAREQPRNMRREEMLEVARCADSCLRSFDLHEPFKFWEAYSARPSHDQDLVELIVHYLEQRK
jgi:hypothetical protein